MVKSDTDVSNFDEDFTSEPVKLSPPEGNSYRAFAAFTVKIVLEEQTIQVIYQACLRDVIASNSPEIQENCHIANEVFR